MNPYLKELYIVFREQLALIYWELYLEDFGFNEEMFMCGCSHNHGDCQAYGTTCGKCGCLNHWAQQCRSSGRRNSSTGRSPPREGHRTDRDVQAATSQTKAGDEEEEEMSSRNLLPKGQAMAVAEEEANPSR